jgi:hypothetical protein
MIFYNFSDKTEIVDIGSAKPLNFAPGKNDLSDQFDWLGTILEDARAKSLVDMMTCGRVKPVTEEQLAEIEKPKKAAAK